MAELIVVCMMSLGMASCMTSLFRVTSPVTRSVVKTSAPSMTGCERSQNCGFLGNQNGAEHPAVAGGGGDAGGEEGDGAVPPAHTLRRSHPPDP